MHTFERKLPKSSSFFFRGVSSSVVSAMASLRNKAPEPGDNIVADDTNTSGKVTQGNKCRCR